MILRSIAMIVICSNGWQIDIASVLETSRTSCSDGQIDGLGMGRFEHRAEQWGIATAVWSWCILQAASRASHRCCLVQRDDWQSSIGDVTFNILLLQSIVYLRRHGNRPRWMLCNDQIEWPGREDVGCKDCYGYHIPAIMMLTAIEVDVKDPIGAVGVCDRLLHVLSFGFGINIMEALYSKWYHSIIYSTSLHYLRRLYLCSEADNNVIRCMVYCKASRSLQPYSSTRVSYITLLYVSGIVVGGG